LRQPFEQMPTILTAEEIINKAFKDAEKVEVVLPDKLPALLKGKRREAARIKAGEQASASYLESVVKSVPSIEEIHPFYRELLELLVGVADAKSALGRLSRVARIIREAARAGSYNLRDSRTPTAAGKARRAFFGRMSSLVRRAGDDLLLIAALREKMKDLPTADPSVPTIVFAGYPGVGKSTIVKALSSAKPETRTYPFTTKEIIIGHAKIGHMTVQMVDTPGILDRPLAKRSQTELLAITALGNLTSIIAFIVDVSEANEFSLKSQKSLFGEVKEMFSGRTIIVFFNKIDQAIPEQLESAEALFGKCDRISALKGEGLDVFQGKIGEAIRESSPAA
jgi:nucleolar GTP-binding protein